jgi:hypothetical protein
MEEDRGVSTPGKTRTSTRCDRGSRPREVYDGQLFMPRPSELQAVLDAE